MCGVIWRLFANMQRLVFKLVKIIWYVSNRILGRFQKTCFCRALGPWPCSHYMQNVCNWKTHGIGKECSDETLARIVNTILALILLGSAKKTNFLWLVSNFCSNAKLDPCSEWHPRYPRFSPPKNETKYDTRGRRWRNVLEWVCVRA